MVTAEPASGSLLEHALAYLRRGLPIFAVCGLVTHMHRDGDGSLKLCADPGKVPLVAWKRYQTELPTEDEVCEMWRRHPDANIGMPTGRLSGVVVVDLDGDLAIHAAQMLGYDNGPHTFTGRVGGVHRYFAYRSDEPRSFAKKLGGIDYRGEGGYVVLPPSRHVLGRSYTFGEEFGDLGDLPALPEWVNGLAKTASEQPARREYGHGDAISEGERNSRLMSIAGGMRYGGAEEHEIIKQLRIVNAERCRPPLDDAELRKLAHSAAHYPAGEVRRIHLNGTAAVEDEPAEEPVELGYVPTFPLEVLPELLQDLITASSLPTNLLAGAYLGACAAAIGGNASAEHGTFGERAILFVVLLAMTGAGKSPALRQAFGPIEARDGVKYREFRDELDIWRNRSSEQKKADREGDIQPPKDPTILFKLATPEAIYRRLDVRSALGLNYDELASFLKGLSRYRNRGDEDTDSALTLWEGSPLRYTRVGTGGGGGNAVDIYIPEPTVTICGGLQPYRQALLGQDLEGLRPRWLVFLHDGVGAGSVVLPSADDTAAYVAMLTHLMDQRAVKRIWSIEGQVWRLLNDLGEAWIGRVKRDSDSPSTISALSKANRYCVRLALVLAEMDRVLRDGTISPAADQLLSPGHLERAAKIVDYSLATWNALGGEQPMAMTFRSAIADDAIPKILEYITRKGGEPINADLLRKNNVAGIQTVGELDEVIKRYEARYPGTIEKSREGDTKGRQKRLISLPIRRKGPADW